MYQDGAHGPQFVTNIVPVTADTGEFPWIAGNSGVNFGTYGLRIQVSLIGNQTIHDRSTETFTVPENTNTFFVNDNSQANDQYTSAIGGNRNTGKLADRPKPYPNNVLRIYSLGPSQTLFVDTGDYRLLSPLVLSNVVGIGDDEGFTLTGPSIAGRTALFHHANQFTVAPLVTLIDADFVTLAHLTLDRGQYGLWAHDSSTNLALTNITVTNSTLDGFRVEGGSTGLLFDRLTSDNSGRYGMVLFSPLQALRNSVASNSGLTGIYFDQPGNVSVERTEVFGNDEYGIYIINSAGTTSVIGDADLSQGDGNKVHDNARDGIYASGTVIVAGNHVYNHLGTNDIGIGVHNGAQAIRNAVHDNYLGIDSQSGGQITENRVYHNTTTGIQARFFSAVAWECHLQQRGRRVADLQLWGALINNLIYANVTHGILAQAYFAIGTNVVNNTIYQPTGIGIRIDNGSRNVRLRNNIIWVLSGVGISVANDAQGGFASDYNLLYATGTGQIAEWQGIGRPTLIAWQNAGFTDGNSLSQDPLFVDLDGADNQLGWISAANDGRDDDFHLKSLYGSFHGGALAPAVNAVSGLPQHLTATLLVDAAQSPAIDRGDPLDSPINEPANNGGYVNLGAYGNSAQASKSPRSTCW